MAEWFTVDFAAMFAFRRSPLDTAIRSAIVYFGICILLRVIPKRQLGNLSPNDLVVIMLIAGIATTALEVDPTSISEVLLVMMVILFCSFLVDWLGFRFTFLRPYLLEPPTTLVKEGKLLRRNLHREMITEDELRAQLRSQGEHELDNIKQACLEADGSISVVKQQSQ